MRLSHGSLTVHPTMTASTKSTPMTRAKHTPLLHGLTLALALAGAACSGSNANRPQPSAVPEPTATASAAPSAAPTAAEYIPPPREPTPHGDEFRANAPEAGATPAFVAPRVTRFRLANGLSVYLAERHEFPVVSVSYVSRLGGDDVAPANAGLASITASMLDLGTTTHDAMALSDAFAALGADHGAMAGWNEAGVSVKVLTMHVGAAVELLAEEVQHPAFAQAEFDRLKGRRLAALQQELDTPRVVAGNVAARVLYGDAHPFGRPMMGTEASLNALTVDSVRGYYAAHYRPESGAIVVAGDVTAAVLRPLLERTFGTWRPARAARVAPVPRAPAMAANAPRFVVVDRSGAPQSHVLVVEQGPPRSSRDYIPLVVANTILGGMFSSRINLNLRERHSYTYGARSGFSFRRAGGPFVIGGAIQAQSTGPAVHEIFEELERMRNSNVTAEELAAAQARVAETLPARFETAEETAGSVGELFLFGLPDNEYATLAQRIRAVTAADVRRVANAYLHPATARVVIVGDRGRIEPQLRELNLGAIEYRTPRGEVVPAAAPQPATTPAAATPSAAPQQ